MFNSVDAFPPFRNPRMNRRSFLLQGGPPHHETFDPKMSAPEGIRSTTGEVQTRLPSSRCSTKAYRLGILFEG